jgi:hypothetical protein
MCIYLWSDMAMSTTIQENGTVINTGSFTAYVPDRFTQQYRNHSGGWSHQAPFQPEPLRKTIVAVQLKFWQSGDGRLKRVYLKGIGPKGGKTDLGYIGNKGSEVLPNEAGVDPKLQNRYRIEADDAQWLAVKQAANKLIYGDGYNEPVVEKPTPTLISMTMDRDALEKLLAEPVKSTTFNLPEKTEAELFGNRKPVELPKKVRPADLLRTTPKPEPVAVVPAPAQVESVDEEFEMQMDIVNSLLA